MIVSFLSSIRNFIANRAAASRFTFPLIMASIIGVLTGFLIVGFVRTIDWMHTFFFKTVPHLLNFMGDYAIVLVPVLGALIVGPIVTFISPEAKGHGVPQVMKAVVLKGGRMRPVVVLGKAIASAVAIGSGASVGREGPIVQVGSALGSNFAQFFKMSESRIKNFLACGAAAGIAGVFNAPIAGVMFSLEVILRDFGARALSTVVVAAVSSSVISRIFLGESPAFIAPAYKLSSPWEIFLYFALGVLSAFTALFFMRVLHQFENVFDSWKFPNWLKPAVGGLVLGITGFYFPQVFGSGLETIESVLHGDVVWPILLSLIFLKIFATSLCLGSGTSGGVFAPALFIGAVLGGAVGNLFYNNMPFPVSPPGAYALVGMASVFSGAAHAPVTAILIVFEMTGDYHMILPIMVSVVVATSLSQILQRESIYTFKLKSYGIDIESLEEVKVLGGFQVRDAMSTDFVTVPRTMTARDLSELMTQEKSKTFYVVNSKEELVGVITPARLQEIIFKQQVPDFIIADDLVEPCQETCLSDDPLTEASHVMVNHNLTQIPVLDPAETKQVLGVLKSEHVFRAYTKLSMKRSDLIERTKQEEGAAEGTIQIHFDLPSKSPLINKQLRRLQIPHGVVLTSIQRKGKTLVPEGDTVLRAKDKVWSVVVPESEKKFRNWLKRNGLEKHTFFGS